MDEDQVPFDKLVKVYRKIKAEIDTLTQEYDTKVEFWVAQSLAWMPVRIRISQVSGNYIDLVLSGSEPLPPLPVAADKTSGAKGS